MGLELFDRDAEPPAGAVTPQVWPETLKPNQPVTWGEVHFGEAEYQTPSIPASQTTLIRAASPTDNRVEDAWMGGGGLCAGAHEGGGEINHGDDDRLFVGSETAATHLPCFNKSFLRFSLADIPPDKAIISATLTLHHWGNADPNQAQPSWVHLFQITDAWDEMGIHWNNAPLAQENISATWIEPYKPNEPIVWPGHAYHWSASQAVAKAYAKCQAVNLAIYSSDSAQHSSKYLTSSETGDWNEAGRPTLRVLWGEDNTGGANFALCNPQSYAVDFGTKATYTLELTGLGNFTAPITLSTTSPSPNLKLKFTPAVLTPPNKTVTLSIEDSHPASSSSLSYQVPLQATGEGFSGETQFKVVVGGTKLYLPLIFKN